MEWFVLVFFTPFILLALALLLCKIIDFFEEKRREKEIEEIHKLIRQANERYDNFSGPLTFYGGTFIAKSEAEIDEKFNSIKAIK